MHFLKLLFLFLFQLSAYELTDGIRAEVAPYLIPNDHPAKKALDAIFTQADFRVVLNKESLEKAGFVPFGEHHTSGIHVLVHKHLKHLAVKCYCDDFYKEDWQYWIARIRGRNFIQQAIDYRGCQKYFKTPKKWIYPIPEGHRAPAGYNEQHYLLIVELMDTYDRKKNREKWKNFGDKNLYWHLYNIITDTGAADSNFVDNIPFCHDGRVAFIDTEAFHRWPISYERMTHYLSHPIKIYWQHLISTGGQKE